MLKKKVKAVDLPSNILENIATICDNGAKEKAQEKARESLETNFFALREALYGLSESVDESEARVVGKHVLDADFVAKVLKSFEIITFEQRKQFKDIFACLLNKGSDLSKSSVDYFKQRPEIISRMLETLNTVPPQTALLYLDMIKAAFQHKPLVQLVVSSQLMWALFDCSELKDFAVSASAFLVLKQMMCDFPSIIVERVSGDRKQTDQLIAKLSRLMSVGTMSQKKKAVELVHQVLGHAEAHQLLLDFAISAEFSKTLDSLLTSKDAQFVVKLAALIDMLSSSMSEDSKAILRANKESIVQILTEAKADEKVITYVREL